MTALFLWLKTTLFGSAVNKLITGLVVCFVVMASIIILPNLGSIYEKFGFQTKESLRATTEVQKVQIDQLDKANENLVKDNKQQEAVSNVTIEAVSDQAKDVKAVEVVIRKVETKKIQKIKQVVADKTTTTDSKDREISKIQLTSLWETYCSFNTDAQCVTELAPT